MSDDPSLQLKPRLAISIDQVQSIIHRVFPNASVADVTELHGGEISTVLEIALADAAACILKIYPASLQWKMAKETYVLRLLQDLDPVVPKILLADDTRSVIDLNYVLMTRLDGTMLGRREATLSEAELFAIYAEMGAALRRINDVTLDSFGYIGPNGVWTAHPSNHVYMSAQFDRKLTEFCTRGGDRALAAHLRDGVAARQHLFEAATTPRLCHYDFHAGNVLVTSQGAPHLTGIVDFENATSGDPLMGSRRRCITSRRRMRPSATDCLQATAGSSVRTGSRPSISIASIARWSSGAGWHRSASVMRSPISRESLRAPHRTGRHAPSPFAPFPLSASSVMCSTETTCSSSAVSNTITPWVERPATRMPSTGHRISWPLSVTSMI